MCLSSKFLFSLIRLFLLVVGCFMLLPNNSNAQEAPPIIPLQPFTLDNAAHLERLAELTGIQNGFAVSPNGQHIAIARPDGVYLYALNNLDEPAAILEIADAPEIQAIQNPVFSPDGKLLAVDVSKEFDYGSTVQLWEIETKTVLKEFQTVVIPLETVVKFSPDGSLLAGESGTGDGTYLYIWDVIGERDFYDPYRYGRYGITDSVFTPDNKTLIYGKWDYSMCCEDWKVFWVSENIFTGEWMAMSLTNLRSAIIDNIDPFGYEIAELNFSPNGTILAASQLWKQVIEVTPMPEASDPRLVKDVVYTYPPYILTSLWNVETGQEITTLPEGILFHAFTPDNTVLVSDPTADALVLLNFHTNEQAALIPYNGHKWQPQLWADGTIISLVDENGTLQLWGVPAR